VLAVGYTYLQAIADESSHRNGGSASQDGAGALRSSNGPGECGTSPAIDGLRAKVELQTRQQQ